MIDIREYLEGNAELDDVMEESTIRPRSVKANFHLVATQGLQRVGEFDLRNVDVTNGSIISEIETVYSPDNTVGPKFEAEFSNRDVDNMRYIVRGQLIEGTDPDGGPTVYAHAKLLVGRDRLETVGQITEKYAPDLSLILSSIGSRLAKQLNQK